MILLMLFAKTVIKVRRKNLLVSADNILILMAWHLLK